MLRLRMWHWRLASLLSGVFVLGITPAQALARAVVRFVHAVPGVGAADLSLTQGATATDLGRASFGQSSAYRSVRSGRFVWKLAGPSGRVLSSGTATLGDASYTIVVLARGSGAVLGLYRDRGGEPGTSLLRMIHAAPELGSPALRVGEHVIAPRASFGQATPYVSVAPGTHTLAAVRPGDPAPLVQRQAVSFRVGRAMTAIVVGSRGERTRIVTVTDRGAPLTRTLHRSHRVMPRSGSSLIVAPGESLWTIARQQLGASHSDAALAAEVHRLWAVNGGRIATGDPNLIFPGQRLRLR